MGRPRKPVGIQKLHGNPGKRKLKDGPQTDLVKGSRPPEHLSPLAADVWKIIAAQLEPLRVLCVGDLMAMEHLCEAYAAAREARRLWQSEGMTIATAKGEGTMLNPAYRAERMAVSEYLQLASRFGLTPADRAGLVLPDPKSDDPGEAWLKEKNA